VKECKHQFLQLEVSRQQVGLLRLLVPGSISPCLPLHYNSYPLRDRLSLHRRFHRPQAALFLHYLKWLRSEDTPLQFRPHCPASVCNNHFLMTTKTQSRALLRIQPITTPPTCNQDREQNRGPLLALCNTLDDALARRKTRRMVILWMARSLVATCRS
jgi:hypothetical protein